MPAHNQDLPRLSMFPMPRSFVLQCADTGRPLTVTGLWSRRNYYDKMTTSLVVQ